MAVRTQVEFIAKTTVRVHATVTDDDDALVDPDTIKVTINDPGGTTQVNAVGMTYASVGVYDYYYRTTISTEKGWWPGEVVVTDGLGDSTKTSVDTFGFRIK